MEIKGRIELPKLIRHFNLPMIAAEVGVDGAPNAIDFIREGIEKIYLVDIWNNERIFKLALERLSEIDESKYVLLKGLSSEMHQYIPDKSLGLVYIDADHRYDSVKQDIQNYYSKLVDGGIIGFHDYINISGVRRAVKEFANEKGLEIHIIPESNDGDAGCWIQI